MCGGGGGGECRRILDGLPASRYDGQEAESAYMDGMSTSISILLDEVTKG